MLKDFCEGKARGEKVSLAQYNYSNQSKVSTMIEKQMFVYVFIT